MAWGMHSCWTEKVSDRMRLVLFLTLRRVLETKVRDGTENLRLQEEVTGLVSAC